MNFDDIQKTWQQQNPAPRISISTEAILNELRRNQRSFTSTIFWRDFREVGAAAALVVYFGLRVWHKHEWTDLLMAIGCLAVGLFILNDRRRQRHQKPDSSDSLKDFAHKSLLQVQHQIWLLRNVLWWYILPIIAPMMIGAAHTSHTLHEFGVHALFIAALGWCVYLLNQGAVKKVLEPRRRELEELMRNFD